MAQIQKIKNFAGYEFTCCNCGRTIKHAYTFEGKSGVYGSECVMNFLPYRVADKQIKEQKKRHEILQKMLNNKKVYNWDKICEARNFTSEQLEDHYLKYGKI